MFNVLILCTHNSARSVLGEAMLNHLAMTKGLAVRAYSAGSAPKGQPNPLALKVLSQANVDVSHIRSKSWDEFASPESPQMNVVITVCDSAAKEACPYWPGAPVQVHWGFPDPSAAPGDEQARLTAFEMTRQAIAFKMLQMLELPLESLSTAELSKALQAISKS